MAKYNVQEKIDAFAGRAEDLAFGELLAEFKPALHRQFKKRKAVIEDWQDVAGELSNFKNRLRVIADKQAWTMDNVMDMALICTIIYNDRINGD